MAGGTLYGFDEASFKRVQEGIRRIMSTPRVGAQRRRQVPILSGGSGGVEVVRFSILSVDCEACTALAVVVSRPSTGFTQGDYSNPYSEYGTTIDIVDLAGCFLNAPEADLIGAIGYAVRLYHDDGAFDRCAIGAGTHWEIMSLCCYGDRDCGSGSA